MTRRSVDLRSAQGMTIVEVLVAAMILLVGISSSYAVVARGQRLASDSQRQEQAVSRAQSELETIRSYPYGNLAMKSAPTSVTTSCSPTSTSTDNWLRSGPSLVVSTSYRDCSGTTLATEPLVVCSGAAACAAASVTTVSTGVALGDGTTASIFRYVSTPAATTTCTSATGGCTSKAAFKRVSVAIVLDPRPSGGLTKPIWSSTVIAEPPPATSGT